MAFRWLSKFRRSKPATTRTEQSERRTPPPPPPAMARPAARSAPPAPPPPPARAPEEVATASEPKIGLILEDGTPVLPPNDPELDEKLRYYAREVIPGAGRSGDSSQQDR